MRVVRYSEETYVEPESKTVTDFEFEDIGVEHSQYFQGRGTSGTDWDDVFVGIGVSAREAADDAAENAAASLYRFTPEKEAELEAEVAKASDQPFGYNVYLTGNVEDGALAGAEFMADVDFTETEGVLVDVSPDGDVTGSAWAINPVDAGGAILDELSDEHDIDTDEAEGELQWLEESEMNYLVALYVKGE